MGPGFPVSIQSLSIAADRYTRLQLNWSQLIIFLAFSSVFGLGSSTGVNYPHSSQNQGSYLALPLRRLGKWDFGAVISYLEIQAFPHGAVFCIIFLWLYIVLGALLTRRWFLRPAIWPTFSVSNALSSCVCSLQVWTESSKLEFNSFAECPSETYLSFFSDCV